MAYMSSFLFQNTIIPIQVLCLACIITHMSYPQIIIPIQLTLLGVHGLSQSFSKAVVLTIAVKVLGMLQHTNPLSLNQKLILRDFYLV